MLRKFKPQSYLLLIFLMHFNIITPTCVVRLREYEHNLSGTANRGPDVGRIYFVILEMSRKSFDICLHISVHTKYFIGHVAWNSMQ